MTDTDVEPSRLGAIRMAMHQLNGNPAAFMFVCHGEPWCSLDQSRQPVSCPWCHTIRGDTPRSAEQIEKDIEAQQRGH